MLNVNFLVVDTLPEEEKHTLVAYGENKSLIKTFPPRQTIAPNSNSLIFEHPPTDRKVYPL